MEIKLKKVFDIGDEWLYYKIYCGKQISDSILIDSILPFTKRMFQENIISSWFFIRYSDPDFHIRLRFKLNNLDALSILIQEIKDLFNGYLDTGFIWDIQIHQYKREIQRYGHKTMEYCETLFFWDSLSILEAKQLQLTDKDSILFLIDYITITLDKFQFSIEEKFQFAERGRLAFKTEFNANKYSIKQIDKKNRNIIDKKTYFNNTFLSKLLNNYSEETKTVFSKIVNLQNKEFIVNDLAHSVIHMTINRYFNSDQRLYEFLIYDVLYKIYKKQHFKSLKIEL